MTSADTDPAVKLQHFATRLIRIARSTHKEHSLSSSQFSVMALLNVQPGMSVVELARRENLAHPTMSRLIAGMIKLGLVSRTANPTDKRSGLLRLTGAGEQLYADVAERRTALFRMLLSRLSEDAIAEILAVVEQMSAPIETTFRTE